MKGIGQSFVPRGRVVPREINAQRSGGMQVEGERNPLG